MLISVSQMHIKTETYTDVYIFTAAPASMSPIETIPLLTLTHALQADQWYRQLVRSHENMQQLVGGQDPTSPLEADWDSASFTTDQSGQAEPDSSSCTAGRPHCPHLSREQVFAKLCDEPIVLCVHHCMHCMCCPFPSLDHMYYTHCHSV